MDNQFPRMLYQQPGTEEIHGGRFASRIVNDQAEQDDAIEQGWHLTTDEAKGASSKNADGGTGTGSDDSGSDDNAPPTREELEAKAKELGIQFAPNIGDAKLLERINDALKAKG